MQEVVERHERIKGVKVLAFDLYDTLFDLGGTIVERVERLGRNVDGQNFAREWRNQYSDWMDKIVNNELPWMKFEDIIDRGLEEIRPRYGLQDILSDDIELLKSAWFSPSPYEDTKAGLELLRKKGYILASMSNASKSIQEQMAQRIGGFDHYYTSDFPVRTFKKDPRFFNQALGRGHAPYEIMMVAEYKGGSRSRLSTCRISHSLYSSRT